MQKNENHVKRIEKRRIATAERLFSEGKRQSKTPKKLSASVARPGAMATPPGLRSTPSPHGPVIDPDPMGDGLSLGGRLTFEGEPGFAVGPMVAAPALEGGEAADECVPCTAEMLASQGLDDESIAFEEFDGDWYAMIDVAQSEGEPRVFNVQGAAELEALLSLSTDPARTCGRDRAHIVRHGRRRARPAARVAGAPRRDTAGPHARRARQGGEADAEAERVRQRLQLSCCFRQPGDCGSGCARR